MSETAVQVYTRPGCPMTGPVVNVLEQSGVPHLRIDIYQDEDAREFVRQVNNGNESVPTLRFPDGSTLTEPGPLELRNKLTSMGHRVPVWVLLRSNWPMLLTGAVILYAILRFLEII